MIGGSSLLRYRDYILHNALDDLRHRYSGTVLGIVWNVLVPLAQILVYAVVFTEVMVVKMPADLPKNAFILYLCSGFFPWLAFMECVLRGGQAFIEHSSLLKKLAIPEEVFVAQAALSSTLGLMISLVLLLLAAVVLGFAPRPEWLLVPVVALLFQAFGFGLGLVLSCLNLFFRDLAALLPILFQIWMWSTPVVYTEAILPAAYRSALAFNPAWPFIRSFHALVVYGTTPGAVEWLPMAAWAAGALLLGGLLVRRLRPEIRDVV